MTASLLVLIIFFAAHRDWADAHPLSEQFSAGAAAPAMTSPLLSSAPTQSPTSAPDEEQTPAPAWSGDYYGVAPQIDKTIDQLAAIGESAVFPNDRESVRLLKRSEELISEGRFAEATQSLGRLMQLADDFFFQPDTNAPTHKSVRSEAARLLDQLPERGRQFYELQFGAEARNELEQALEAGDVEAIAETARRYFHTDAGFEASYLVALDHLDHGRPLLASLILQRLRDSSRRTRDWEPMLSVRLATSWARGGELEHAHRVWREMGQRYGDVAVRVGNRSLQTGSSSHVDNDRPDAFAWLAEVAQWSSSIDATRADGWLVFRGSPSRNTHVDGGEILLRSRWRVRTNTDPVLDEMLSQQQHTYHDVGLAPLPAAHPLVVGDIVLTRTLTNLTAVDYESGKRLWESASGADAHEVDEMALSADAPSALTLRQGLEQRVWNDVTFGTLASDGSLVFAIEDLSLAMTNQQAQMRRGGFARNLWRSWNTIPYNRLAAYDIHTGKLAWEAGGARSDGLPLADTFFLGPPLPLAGKLYVLAERDGEIRLWVLDAASGEADWSQLLVVVEPDRSLNASRRMVGLSPSYADGVLVCPTASGAVVAVDLTKRGLLWGFQYSPRDIRHGGAWPLQPGGIIANRGQNRQVCRWIDGSITLADGYVVVAPIESDELHCLDLHTGIPHWTASPNDASYVAGVDNGRVIVIGQRSAQAYGLEDGSPAWGESGAIFPEQVNPTGRGFLRNGSYQLPTRQGGLARIDLEHGELNVAATASAGPVLGNLVVHRGSIISATAHGVDRYLQTDAARQALDQYLASATEDPGRYALEGELLLQEGKLDEAVAALELGKDIGGGVRLKSLLLEALLLGFESDFQQYRDRADEIQQLLQHANDRAVYHRLLAIGLLREGDLVGALDAYLSFADSLDDLRATDILSPTLSVRRDRWLQAGISEILEQVEDHERGADDEQRALVEQRIQARFDAASQNGPSGLRRFIDLFDAHRLADEARVALTSGSPPEGRPIETELLLRELQQSGNRQHRAYALAQLAMFYRRMNRPEDALLHARTLGAEHADTVCHNDQTGRELADEFEADSALTDSLRATDTIWPPGCAEVQETTPGGRTTSRAITLHGLPQRDTLHTLAQLELDLSKRTLVGRDPLGQVRWQASLGQAARQIRPNPQFSFATSLGHLALLTLGTEVYAVNTIHSGDPQSGDVLWQTSLVPDWPDTSQAQVIGGRPTKLPWGGGRPSLHNALWRPVGVEGYVSERAVCYVRQRKVVALDPLTGAEQWSHDGFSPGSTLFGNPRRLIVTPPDGEEAVVLQLVDGRRLGTRKVPTSIERMATVGINVLAWTPYPNNDTDTDVRIHLYDAWNESDVWSRDFPAGSKADLIGQEYVGVMDRDGRFQLISIDTGDAIIDTTLDPEPQLLRLCLLETPSHWIVATERSSGSENPHVIRQAVPPSAVGVSAMVDGQIRAFDRRTHQLAWSRDVQHAGLRLDQPSASPVLVFVTAVQDTAAEHKNNTYRYEVLCLDTRTGEVLYDEERQGRLPTYDLATQPDKRSVDILLLQTHGVTITFHCDEPTGTSNEAEDSEAITDDSDSEPSESN